MCLSRFIAISIAQGVGAMRYDCHPKINEILSLLIEYALSSGAASVIVKKSWCETNLH